jgi:DNA polymerase/3'-5' exonuclease PolX
MNTTEAVMDNRTLAERLTGMAHDLERKRSSVFRSRAYRRAAETILGMDCPVEDLVAQGGRKLLKAMPGIGPKISRKIEELIRSEKEDRLAVTPP